MEYTESDSFETSEAKPLISNVHFPLVALLSLLSATVISFIISFMSLSLTILKHFFKNYNKLPWFFFI